MEKLNHRIWLCDIKEKRQLLSVKRNAYGDILFELDGGLTREFAPHSVIDDFEIERVYVLGRHTPPDVTSCLVLQNPRASFSGNIRDIQTPPKDETPAGLEIGWKHNRLQLISKPENRKPAIFRFGSKDYFVPSGKAWDWVQNVILQSGFEGHPIETESASNHFKGEKYLPFFRDLIKPGDGSKKYYIRTK